MLVLKTRTPIVAAVMGALALGIVGGCSSGPKVEEVDAPAPTPQSSTPQSEPAPQSQDAWEGDEGELPQPVDEEYWTLSSFADPGTIAEQPAIVTGFDLSSDAEYDRFTITLTGEGPVGWDASYVEQAIEDGRGEVIALDGNAFLDIRVSGVSIPETDEEYAAYYQGGPISADGLNATYDGTYEGAAHFVIGMGSPRQFDMFMLANPLRVIVDIRK